MVISKNTLVMVP